MMLRAQASSLVCFRTLCQHNPTISSIDLETACHKCEKCHGCRCAFLQGVAGHFAHRATPLQVMIRGML